MSKPYSYTKKEGYHTHIRVWFIVFLQGDDYYNMLQELSLDQSWLTDRDESKIKQYLMQWFMDDIEHYQNSLYRLDITDINTAFLGDACKIDGRAGYLFALNTRLGYAGLSRYQYERIP